MLECPQFDDVRAQYADLLQDARDSMRNLMWHQNQKALSDFVIAILDEPRTCTLIRPHRPCWPETCLYGGAFTFRHVVLPLRVPSFAPICGGLRGRTGLARSPITSCPFQ